MLLEKQCPMCFKWHTLELNCEQTEKYFQELDDNLVQEVFPEMTPTEREFIITGYCNNCQELIFDGEPSNKIKVAQ